MSFTSIREIQRNTQKAFMGKLFTTVALGVMLSLANGATFAKDVKLTEAQVKTVCDGKLDSHVYKEF